MRIHIHPRPSTTSHLCALHRTPPSRFELDDGHPVLYVYELQVDRLAQVGMQIAVWITMLPWNATGAVGVTCGTRSLRAQGRGLGKQLVQVMEDMVSAVLPRRRGTGGVQMPRNPCGPALLPTLHFPPLQV